MARGGELLNTGRAAWPGPTKSLHKYKMLSAHLFALSLKYRCSSRRRDNFAALGLSFVHLSLTELDVRLLF